MELCMCVCVCFVVVINMMNYSARLLPAPFGRFPEFCIKAHTPVSFQPENHHGNRPVGVVWTKKLTPHRSQAIPGTSRVVQFLANWAEVMRLHRANSLSSVSRKILSSRLMMWDLKPLPATSTASLLSCGDQSPEIDRTSWCMCVCFLLRRNMLMRLTPEMGVVIKRNIIIVSYCSTPFPQNLEHVHATYYAILISRMKLMMVRKVMRV